jgi:hypothetical protein
MASSSQDVSSCRGGEAEGIAAEKRQAWYTSYRRRSRLSQRQSYWRKRRPGHRWSHHHERQTRPLRLRVSAAPQSLAGPLRVTGWSLPGVPLGNERWTVATPWRLRRFSSAPLARRSCTAPSSAVSRQGLVPATAVIMRSRRPRSLHNVTPRGRGAAGGPSAEPRPRNSKNGAEAPPPAC